MRLSVTLAGLAGLLLMFAWLPTVHNVRAQNSAPYAKVPLRVVVFTESDGTNPAMSLKQIEQQMTQLRVDGMRHGLEFVMQASTFVADSRHRHADAAALARTDGKASPDFPPSKDAIVLYVTDLSRKDLKAPPYLVRAPHDTSSQPAIVIDASEFGADGCGPSKDQPCRALTQAIAQALISHTQDAALRNAAENMKSESLRREKS